jgi:hypothetical protein
MGGSTSRPLRIHETSEKAVEAQQAKTGEREIGRVLVESITKVHA